MKTRWQKLLDTQTTEPARRELARLNADDPQLAIAIANAREDLTRFETCVVQLQLFLRAARVVEAKR